MLKAFVLGHPVEHSLSPVLHKAAYSFLGKSISYEKLDTDAGDFKRRLLEGNDDSQICGYSVTMPLKKEACASVDYVSQLGKTIGVINTVYWRNINGQQESFGHNTDISGILNALVFAGLQKTEEGRLAVLGGGGTAISAVVAGYLLGYKTVDVFVRSAHRAQDVRDLSHKIGMGVELKTLDDFPQVAEKYEAVISTLPARAADSWAGEIGTIQRRAALLDVSYDPWPSQLALRWKDLNGSVVSGLEMLLYQALEQVKLFLGMEANDRFEDEIGLLNAMAKSLNLELRDELPLVVTFHSQD